MSSGEDDPDKEEPLSCSEFDNTASEFVFPTIQQGPVDRAGAEVGHVGIAFESLDRRVDQLIVLLEDRPMRG